MFEVKINLEYKKELIRKSTPGFTFLEILVVISILSILFLISAPRFKGVALKNQLQTGARELALLLRLARAESIHSGFPVQVKINVDEGWYQLSLPPREEDDTYYPGEDRRRTEVERRRYLPRDVGFKEVSTDAPPVEKDKRIARVIFFPNSSATGATIVLVNKKGNTMTIDVAPSTGIARVYRGEPVSPGDAESLGVEQ